ncbi:phasin family protein [Pantoea ananatis]|uniref:phasin family protein n=1 Tax=Pantoea ananas TaxID=553 RepID=UPI002220E21C|nr:phasin family protein [Pantoea ananatis]
MKTFEKNVSATTGFLGELTEARDLGTVQALWPKGLQIARDNFERLATANQEVFGLGLKASEAIGQLAKHQFEAATEQAAPKALLWEGLQPRRGIGQASGLKSLPQKRDARRRALGMGRRRSREVRLPDREPGDRPCSSRCGPAAPRPPPEPGRRPGPQRRRRRQLLPCAGRTHPQLRQHLRQPPRHRRAARRHHAGRRPSAQRRQRLAARARCQRDNTAERSDDNELLRRRGQPRAPGLRHRRCTPARELRSSPDPPPHALARAHEIPPMLRSARP